MWGPRGNANSDSIDPARLDPRQEHWGLTRDEALLPSHEIGGQEGQFSYFDPVGPNDRRPLCKAK